MSFKVCSNPGCPFCLHHGAPAQYLPVAQACQHCGGGLVAIEGPSRDAPTVFGTDRRAARFTREHAVFFVGMAGVLVPHLLARIVGPVAYALPVLAIAYAVARVAGKMEPAWLATARAARRPAS